MTDIVVHRCELRIRRTSGWAWGASPDELIAAATRAIPQLLAARLPDLAVPAGTTISIDRPITVKLVATARQLVALASDSAGTDDVVQLRAKIEAEVAAAVARAIAEQGVASVSPAAQIAPADESPAHDPAIEEELASADAPRRAVRAWWRLGSIDAVMQRLEPDALARLHELLLGESSALDEPRAELVAVIERAAAGYAGAPATPLERIQRRVALAAAAIDAAPDVPKEHLRAAIDHVITLEDGLAAAVAETARAQEQEATARRAPAVDELSIRSALPFLLLASLRNAGWLEAAATLLGLHRRQTDAFALAAGLAARVLDPLERGWKRSYADRLAIAVFAGRTEPIDDVEIAAAATRLRPLLGPLDASLRGLIGRARRPVPVVLWRDDRGWQLFDGDGMVALAASTVLADVVAVAPPAPIVVPARFAARDVFDVIDYANATFVTDALPGRSDTWRAFASVGGRLHTNDTTTPAGKLAALTAQLDQTLALAEELVEVLAERPAIPRGPLDAFEATATLAATAALADIGGRLFPGEPTTPVLALTRFRDLDARVVFEAGRVHVRVPLGRRHADLLRHGVLGELANVPWLPDRTVDIGGG